jgi:hypothetical protein
MKIYTALGNTFSEELLYQFANLMYVGFTPEQIKHKLDISSDMLESIAEAYFNNNN